MNEINNLNKSNNLDMVFDSSKIRIKYLKKAYRIFNNNEKFKITTPKCSLPFGLEQYYDKVIANLEFNIDNNDSYNYISIIKNIDATFRSVCSDSDTKIYNIPHGLANELNKTLFVGSIKERFSKCFHHRCHIKKTSDFTYLSEELKGKEVIATIELDHIWKHGNEYGLVWYIDDIKIV